MRSSDVVVRVPVPDDARGLAEAHIAAWRAAYRGVMTDEFLDGLDVDRRESGWRRHLPEQPAGTRCLVAEVDGQIAGFVIVGQPADDEDIPALRESGEGIAVGQLYAINLHPDWWAHGIGTLLLTGAADELRGLGYSHAYLWVEQSNERAIAFYTSRGWTADGGTKEETAYSPPLIAKRHVTALT